MSDPTNENAGATPPENPPAGGAPEAQQPAGEAAAAAPAAADEAAAAAPAAADEAQTAAMPAAGPAPEQPAAAAGEAPTAVYSAAPAGAPPAPPRQAWYRRRWAVITGAVAAAVILFLGGVAVGTSIGDNGRGDFRAVHNAFPGGGDGFGHQGWGDDGMGRRMAPGMGQDYGHGWDQDGYGRPQAPGTIPAPLPSQSASPQALTQ